MHILATYGDLRSGKDYIAEELTRRLSGFVSYPTSLPIRHLLDALNSHLPVESSVDKKDAARHTITQVSKAAHDAFGPDIWIDLSIRDLQEQHKEGIILTGLRLVENLDSIHAKGGLNIWVEASKETIAERYKAKGLVLTDELYDNVWDTQIRPFKHDPSRIDIIIRNDGNTDDTEQDLKKAVAAIRSHFRLSED